MVQDPLVLDLVEWCLTQQRTYSDVMDAWRTSCPRLTVWEDAIDGGLLRREPRHDRVAIVAVTALGREVLKANGRIS